MKNHNLLWVWFNNSQLNSICRSHLTSQFCSTNFHVRYTCTTCQCHSICLIFCACIHWKHNCNTALFTMLCVSLWWRNKFIWLIYSSQFFLNPLLQILQIQFSPSFRGKCKRFFLWGGKILGVILNELKCSILQSAGCTAIILILQPACGSGFNIATGSL